MEENNQEFDIVKVDKYQDQDEYNKEIVKSVLLIGFDAIAMIAALGLYNVVVGNDDFITPIPILVTGIGAMYNNTKKLIKKIRDKMKLNINDEDIDDMVSSLEEREESKGMIR